MDIAKAHAIKRDSVKHERMVTAALNKSAVKRLQAQSIAPTFRSQYVLWLHRGTTRNRNPFRPETARVYKSQVETNILPVIGDIPLDVIGNKVLKDLANEMKLKGLSASTINRNILIIKDIRKSAKNEDGEQLYPYTWDAETIDAPMVDIKKQKRPIADAQTVQDAISKADTRDGCLWAILAGGGLRVAEAMALDIGPDRKQGYHNYWLPEESKIIIRGQFYKGVYGPPKTGAGERETDLCPALNDFLKKRIQFGVEPGVEHLNRMMFRSNVRTYVDHLKRDGIIGGFHSLRRYRVTYLRLQGIPESMIHFWVGHADSTVTGRYTEVGPEIEARKQQAVRAGLGFQLPEGV